MKTINLHSGEYKITLLTKAEYAEHKGSIPLLIDWWWLRSPGDTQRVAAVVDTDGSLGYDAYVDIGDVAARPALKSGILNLPIGERFAALGNRWVMIDDGFAISEDVITHRRYDAESNIWKTSELKAWLEEWAREGETE